VSIAASICGAQVVKAISLRKKSKEGLDMECAVMSKVEGDR
jgi:hypothetical protein